METTKNVEYAVVLIKSLNDTRPTKLENIAVAKGLSMAFMEQVARKLRQAGIIASFRGPGGGYVICDRKITFYDIERVMHEEREISPVIKPYMDQVNSVLKSIEI